MSTSDPTGCDHVPEASSAGPTRMDVQTTQQMLREMTTLTGAMFSLLQPHRAPEPEPEPTTPGAAPSSPAASAAAIVSAAPLPALSAPSIPLPDLPLAASATPVAPQSPATAPIASIPLPSLPVPDLPSPEPEPQAADEEDQPAKGGRLSMALMNEIAFLDD